MVIAPPGQSLPQELEARMKVDVAEITLTLKAAGPAQDGRRTYAAQMPVSAAGPVSLQLDDQPSNVLVMVVARRGDAVQTLTGLGAGGREPPLSENDPMYFVIGTRGGTTARFQLSFKYRLFDFDAGFGQERPWLSGLYFGYTQNSLWDLESESKAFRDTSYQPSLFWKWERTEEQPRLLIDGARLGLEHESNGGQGERSRSINTAFVRPEWRWKLARGRQLRVHAEDLHATSTRKRTPTSTTTAATSTGARATTRRPAPGSRPPWCATAPPARAACCSTSRAASATSSSAR